MKPESQLISESIESLRERLNALKEFINYVNPHLEKGKESVIKENAVDLAPMFLYLNQIDSEKHTLSESDKNLFIKACQNKIKFKNTEKEGKKEVKMFLPEETSQKLNKALKALTNSYGQPSQLYESSLVSLVSTIEVFFSKIFHIFYSSTEDMPGNKEKYFSYQDLKKIGSISEAKEILVENKIEDILRGSFNSWTKILKESLDLNMGYMDSHIDSLTDACLKRNLIVHNGGIINKIYINRVSQKEKQSSKIGDNLTIDEKYLNNILEIFELNCSLIGFEYWKKNYPEDRARGKFLLDYSFDALCEKRYQLSEGLARFLVSDKKQKDEDITAAQLNLWLSHKKNNDWEKSSQQYSCADFSAKSLRLRTAHAALGDSAEEFFSLATKAKIQKEINAEEFGQYPIFDFFREDPRFKRLVTGKNPKTKKAKTKVS